MGRRAIAEEATHLGPRELVVQMAGSQGWRSNPSTRGGIQQCSPPLTHGNTSVVNRKAPEIQRGTAQPLHRPEYVQQLYGVLGPEMAEYFLNPPPMEVKTSPEIQRLIAAMGDSSGAERLWAVIRAESHQRLLETQPTGNEGPRLEQLGYAQQMERSNERRYRLHLIRRTAELHQDRTTLLIANNTSPDLYDLCVADEPARYFLPAP
ncbi:uncharacterized protein [Ambystoma mexicanum]|uniref:uncharacterized protein isoform X2 n=1 Tax=Ambystoma mexicanum TaxID=8296 RepID=UPI0037E91D30